MHWISKQQRTVYLTCVASPDENIFNILNYCGNDAHSFFGLLGNACCDFVTHIPGLANEDFFGSAPQKRHGQEAHIDMVPEEDISWTGLVFVEKIAANHKMPAYLGWMDARPDNITWPELETWNADHNQQ